MSVKRQKHLGFTGRLAILINFLMLTAFGIFAAGMFLFGRYSIEQRIKDVANDSLEMANAALTQTVWVYDEKEMHTIAEALIQRNQGVIIGVRIVGNAGEVLTEKMANSQSGAAFEIIAHQEDNQKFERALIKNEELIGAVQIIFSPAKLKAEFNHHMRYLYLILALLAVFCSATVFWVTNRFLNPPLKGLVKVAEKIRSGDYEIETGYWKHEFSILFQAFAAAAEDIQKRDQALKNYAENLEIQVMQRTKELDTQRMQMVSSSRLASLGEVSAGIAHEINNPLAIIQGKAELLMRNFPEQSVQREQVDKIIQMVKRISTIVKGLRTFARDGSKDPMRPFRLTPFLSDLQDLCQARMKNHDIELAVDCRISDGFGREVQISQVLINLLNNSIDAVQDVPKKWIRLEAFERNGHLIFAVTDSGAGVPVEIREKIMEPFFTTKPIGKGTGMGLSISIGICRDHGGDLQYVAQSKHTRFEVILPLPQANLRAA